MLSDVNRYMNTVEKFLDDEETKDGERKPQPMPRKRTRSFNYRKSSEFGAIEEEENYNKKKDLKQV